MNKWGWSMMTGLKKEADLWAVRFFDSIRNGTCTGSGGTFQKRFFGF